MDDFSTWVKRTRQYHGMTLGELAKKADVTKSTIWEIEQTTRTLDLLPQRKLLMRLGVSFG